MSSDKPRSFFLSSLPFFILAHATHHLLTALPQSMQPFIQDEFGLSKARLGGITAAFSISSAASQLPAGWLADRIGPTWLITIGVLGVGIGGALVGLSNSYTTLLLFLVFMGLMAGGYHPASTPLISVSVPANQRGRALGLHLIGGNSSFFLSPLIAGSIAAAWGWRGSFITLAIPTIILGFCFFLYLNKRYGKAHIEAMKRRQMEEHPPQPGYKRRLMAFLTMMVIGGGAGATVNSFLPVYIKEVLGASNKVSAMSLSIIYSSGLWAGPIGGWISDRIGATKVVIATGIMSGLAIFALKEVSLGWGLWVVLWIIGIIQAVRFPVTEVFIMSQSPARNRSTIYGIYYSTMQYTGAIFAPVMGGLIDRFGFAAMFNFAAWAVTAVAVVTALFIWDTKD
ncbi:MAG TPA: MFS transporter [Acidobacteriota bacterium]|nr:MFS transporter [Acidobacteriota bacterium]